MAVRGDFYFDFGLLAFFLFGVFPFAVRCWGGLLATTLAARSKRSHASGTNSMSDDALESFAMPQPLNRVIPNATVNQYPNTLDSKPELLPLVSSIFAHWSLIEYRLSLLLVRVLGADAAPALAMFSTLTAQHLQLGALEAAAKAALTPTEFDVFKTAMTVTDSVQTPRNHLAHWVWGYCPELPEALLLIEPKALKEQDIEFTKALEAGITDPAELARLNTYNPKHVLVYRKNDLLRAKRDLEEAAEMVFLVMVYLDGFYRGRRKLPPGVTAGTRDHLFRQLYGLRMFREAWDRTQEDRKKSPQPRPE